MFLTGTTNIQAGNGETFTLDYDALAVVAGAKDPYFAEKAVIKEVICLYQEASSVLTRPQRKSLSYKDGSLADQIVFSVKANAGTWELTEVIVKDFDGGDVTLTPSDIPDRALYEIYLSAAI